MLRRLARVVAALDMVAGAAIVGSAFIVPTTFVITAFGVAAMAYGFWVWRKFAPV